MGQTFCRLADVIQSQIEIERPLFFYDLVQVTTLYEFHDHVVRVAFATNVVDANHVRIVQTGSGATLAIKTVEVAFVGDLLFGQDFQRPPFARDRMFGQIDTAHPTRAKMTKQFILT